MDMLANQLGISKRTIYEIFRDKDELLRGVLKFMGEKQQELIKKVFDESENVVEAILIPHMKGFTMQSSCRLSGQSCIAFGFPDDISLSYHS